MNPQIAYGEDVISRLAYAERTPGGSHELAMVVRSAIDGLVGGLADRVGVAREQVVDGCVVGNTAMHHLYLGLPTRQLAVAPFVAASAAPMDVRSRDLDLAIAPDARVHIPACIAGFVGADHVAMILGADLDRLLFGGAFGGLHAQQAAAAGANLENAGDQVGVGGQAVAVGLHAHDGAAVEQSFELEVELAQFGLGEPQFGPDFLAREGHIVATPQ